MVLECHDHSHISLWPTHSLEDPPLLIAVLLYLLLNFFFELIGKADCFLTVFAKLTVDGQDLLHLQTDFSSKSTSVTDEKNGEKSLKGKNGNYSDLEIIKWGGSRKQFI